jgi:hypothetical protein
VWYFQIQNLGPADQISPDDAILVREHQNNDMGDQPRETDKHPSTAELADHLLNCHLFILIKPGV